MSKLSEKIYWDSLHDLEKKHYDANAHKAAPDQTQTSRKKKLILKVKKILGPGVLSRMSSYDDYLLWNVIFKKHLPELKGAKVLEVGSAPGEFLVRFSEKFDCEPYGVEYSESGVQVNREVFSAHGVNPENVINADFFSEHFQEQYREHFDVVVSRGFIEHFTEVEEVIDKHLNLLKEGGYLIISVPNLRGANYALTHMFSKEILPLHNLDIMKKPEFSKLFDRSNLSTKFCDYYGTFTFYLFDPNKNSPHRLVRNIGYGLQPLLNLTFRSLLRDKGAENEHFSPALLFIGRKTR